MVGYFGQLRPPGRLFLKRKLLKYIIHLTLDAKAGIIRSTRLSVLTRQPQEKALFFGLAA
jgi:hypothetical protein